MDTLAGSASNQKGSAMPLRHATTVDDLLSDSLVQMIMRADHVEPHQLNALLSGAAGRVDAARRERGSPRASAASENATGDRRNRLREPSARLAGRVSGGNCGSALCC
jgi:hypothetical protein